MKCPLPESNEDNNVENSVFNYWQNMYKTGALNLNTDVYKFEDWDLYWNFNMDRYSYYLPLITQTFPETDNQKNWPDNLLTRFVLYISKK